MDLNRPFKTVILEMINTANPLANLTDNDFILSVPSANTDTGHSANSKINVVANPNNAGVTGQKTVYYNRLSLSDVLANSTDSFEVIDSDNTDADNVAALVAAIKARYGVDCSAADFVFEGELATGTVTITAADDSVWFVGSASVELANVDQGQPQPPPPPQMNLDEVIENPDLDGLDYTFPPGEN